MDDFGTGYSSLSYLWQFSFDTIKIDRSFVHALGSGTNVESLLRSIITLGESLDLRVVAEGVENAEQAHFLMANSCRHVQGFLFGHPVPEDNVMAIIEKDARNAEKPGAEPNRPSRHSVAA